MKAKHIVIVALVLGFVAFVLLAPQGKKDPSKTAVEGYPAPALTLKDATGRPWSLASKKGSVVVVNFWATWCPPCRSEMPSLNNLFLKTMNMKGLEVVTVLYRDSTESAADFMRQSNYSLPFLLDPDGAVASAYGLTGVPETFIIDRKGVLRKLIIGPTDFDAPSTTDYLQSLLAEQP